MIYFLVVIILLTTVGYIVLQTSYVQTVLVNYFASNLSESLNTKVSVKKVDIDFFNKLILEDVFISDKNLDTLIFISKLDASISGFSYSKKQLYISGLQFNKMDSHIKKYTSGLNIQFIIDELSKSDTTTNKAKWDINCKNFSFNNCSIEYLSSNYKDVEYGMNYNHLIITKLNLSLRNLQPKDTTSFIIESLSFNESCGLRMSDLQAKVQITKNSISLNNFATAFEKSSIDADYLNFKFKSFKDIFDFSNNVKIETRLTGSSLLFNDLAYFAPSLKDFNEIVSISGDFKGKLVDLRGKRVNIDFSKDNHFKGSFSIIGLPNIKHTFIYADIDELATSKHGLESIQFPKKWLTNSISLPKQLESLGAMRYTGNLTGFLNDFVAFGTLSSNLGIVSTDLGLKKNLENGFDFRGNIKTEHFKIADLTGESSILGEVDLHLEINGRTKKNQVDAKVDGMIDSISINNYRFHDIKLRGSLANKRFDGFVFVKDTNLDLDFTGSVDFSKDIPEFDFTSSVNKAVLDKLNLYDKDSLPILSFTMKSNFIGNNIDNLKGEIILWDTKYKTATREVSMDEFLLISNPEDTINSLQLTSSMADINMVGNYSFAGLSKSLPEYFYHFYPSFKTPDYYYNGNDSLSFDIDIKEMTDFFAVFFPDISISPNSNIHGSFNSLGQSLEVNGEFIGLDIFDTHFDKLVFESNSNADSLIYLFNSKQVFYDGITMFENFYAESRSLINNLSLDIYWQNNDSIEYAGDISSEINFTKTGANQYPKLDLHLKPSVFTIADSLWSINECDIIVDSSFISFNGLDINRNDEYILLSGNISNLPEDTLNVDFQNIPLSVFNLVSKSYGFDLVGTINGKSSLTSVYKDVVFTSDLKVDSLFINNHSLGNASISSKWDNNNSKLNLIAHTHRGQISPVNIDGFYIPSNKKVNFDIVLDKLHLGTFEPFLSSFISNLNGIASDKLKLTGTIKKPILTGRLKLQKVNFRLDYLNTVYNFSDYVDIEKNIIKFNDISIYDDRGEKAILNGEIKHNYFDDLFFNFDINATDFTFLNTHESDNNLYFGTAYSTGNINLNGNLDNIVIDIKAKTDEGTKFFIPLSSESEISENNFITFINKDSLITQTNLPEENVDLSGIQLNFELEVTPEAEVQLIFDSKVGDIIKGIGNANLKMEINTNGEFNMYGDYTISKGEYLFTLANFLSKKFKVKDGGTISWNGDPYDAIIDIETYYGLTTTLQDLYMDTSEIYRKKIPVECQIFMTNKLMNPEFNFAIDLPNSGESERALIQSLPEDELNKQFISLLFIKKFQPLSGLNFANTGTTNNLNITESTSEILSNQLSHWLSQISNDFDIGFTYRPGDEVTTDEVEVALATQLFNDRLTINGNLGVGGEYENTNSIVGDVEADLKLNKAGKIRIKAFSKSNTNFDYNKGPTTQGLGLVFREEFDSFEELLRKYFRRKVTAKTN